MFLPTNRGSVRLFRVAGISVYLHWLWFVVALLQFQYGAGRYSSALWSGLEYVALFGIVLLHEFGHALACRSVGGKAEQIILWPFGGVAYVSPPQRPGATLWSIAAGPLVNVVLFGGLTGLLLVGKAWGWRTTLPNGQELVWSVWVINLVLLGFNLLPVYPLDGGQMLRSVLWFWLGRARSLAVATAVGLVGVAGLLVLAVVGRSMWLGIMTVFIAGNCWRGWQEARALLRLAKLPRHVWFTCPQCRVAPPRAPIWVCEGCRHAFDVFESGGTCPACQREAVQAWCVECGNASPVAAWRA
jgi:Zn-dependent protease